MSWILVALYFAIILYFIPRIPFFQNTGLSKFDIRMVYSIKVAAGFALFAIYFFYYGNNRSTADSFRFFDDALIIYEQLFSSPLTYFKTLFGIALNDPEVASTIENLNNWFKPYNQGVYNDNQSIIRFNALAMLLSFGNFHIHTLLMNLLSMFGLMAIYRLLKSELNLGKYTWLLAVFFLPQVILWSLGVLKEGLLLLAMGLFIYAAWKIVSKADYSINHFLILAFSFWGLLLVKNYIILCLMPSLIFLFAQRFLPKLKKVNVALIVLGACATMIILLSQIEALGLLEKIVSKQVDFIRLGIMSNSGSYFELSPLSPNLASFFKTIPEALLNASLCPFIYDSSSVFEYLASLEALFIVFLIISAFIIGPKQGLWNSNTFWFSFLFYLSLLVIIGLVTPVSGAIVRYRIPALVILLPVLVNFLPNKLHAFTRKF